MQDIVPKGTALLLWTRRRVFGRKLARHRTLSYIFGIIGAEDVDGRSPFDPSSQKALVLDETRVYSMRAASFFERARYLRFNSPVISSVVVTRQPNALAI